MTFSILRLSAGKSLSMSALQSVALNGGVTTKHSGQDILIDCNFYKFDRINEKIKKKENIPLNDANLQIPK
jgi:hypothetical protein